ncbi:MAG: OmpA family protein [Elusimicrobia bacterium]|nr:OmpA family protein [Elusimicrobiota bacterium]
MKTRYVLPFLAAVFLSGCISIATHEEQMRQCRALAARAEELEKQAAEKSAEQERLQKELKEVRGTYEDVVSKLKDDLAKGEIKVEQTGEAVTITLGDKVLFRSGQYELQPSGREVLAGIAGAIKKYEADSIRVEGHTDNVRMSGALAARFPSNWELSAARAGAVVRFLEKSGVDPALLVLEAYGDNHPVGDNATVEGRQANRRVEITLVPKKLAADRK